MKCEVCNGPKGYIKPWLGKWMCGECYDAWCDDIEKLVEKLKQ